MGGCFSNQVAQPPLSTMVIQVILVYANLVIHKRMYVPRAEGDIYEFIIMDSYGNVMCGKNGSFRSSEKVSSYNVFINFYITHY